MVPEVNQSCLSKGWSFDEFCMPLIFHIILPLSFRSNVADAKNFFFFPCQFISYHFSGSGVTAKACVPPGSSSLLSVFFLCRQAAWTQSDGKTGLVIWGEDAGQIIVPTFIYFSGS